MASSKWSGVQIHIGTLGAALPVSAITKASPGVATYTGTDPTDGDYFALTNVLGMHQVNNRIFRAKNVNSASDTVELEGEDTTLYDTFISGGLQPITWASSLSVVRGLSVSGGDFDMIDETTIHDLVRTQSPNQANALSYSLQCKWDPSDAGLLSLNAATKVQALRAVRFTFLNGYKSLFLGYVAAVLAPTGNAGDIVETPVTFTANGALTFYTT